MCVGNKGDPNSLLLSLANGGNKLVFLDFVNTPFGRNNSAREVISEKFRILIKDG